MCRVLSTPIPIKIDNLVKRTMIADYVRLFMAIIIDCHVAALLAMTQCMNFYENIKI